MTARESLDPDASMWDWIAVDLRFYRQKHGLSQSQLGRIMACTRHTVSNLEAGRDSFHLNDDQAQRLDQHWGLNGHFGRLLRHARAGHNADWFREHVSYEAAALEMRIYECLIAPGLLQTEDYARAMLSNGIVKDVEGAIQARMDRQEILVQPDPPLLWVLVLETALEIPVGGVDVMRLQLRRLLDAAEQPNIVLRVVPRSAGGHLGLDGSFKIMTLPGVRDVAYIEAPGGGRVELDSTSVRKYAERYGRIGAQALPENASKRRLAEIMEAM